MNVILQGLFVKLFDPLFKFQPLLMNFNYVKCFLKFKIFKLVIDLVDRQKNFSPALFFINEVSKIDTDHSSIHFLPVYFFPFSFNFNLFLESFFKNT